MSTPLSLPVRRPLVPSPTLYPRAGVGWIYLCLGVQIFCQLSLIVSWLSPARVVARSASLGISLALLFLVPGRPFVQHPVRVCAVVIFFVLGLSSLHPEGARLVGVAGHAAFYVAVIAPVFWVARLNCDEKALQNVLIVLWLFSTASACVGVLQAYFPGRFLPSAGFLHEYGPRNVGALMIQLASGAVIPRPTGLTDTPGGAVGGSFFAVLLSLGIALVRPFRFARLAAVVSSVAGMTCIYLCQVRSALVMLACCFLVVIGLFALAGRVSRSATIALGGVGIVLVAFAIALDVGGEAVVNRLQTLTAQSPTTVYYASRGRMVEGAFLKHLPDYPLGAGLGRWGMVAYYFSGGERVLWAEVQWSGWVFDGGIAMLLAYPAAIIVALMHSVRLALLKTTPGLEIWATVVAGYNVGAIALTFSYALFMSSAGVEFWLINALLIQAAAMYAARKRDETIAREPLPTAA